MLIKVFGIQKHLSCKPVIYVIGPMGPVPTSDKLNKYKTTNLARLSDLIGINFSDHPS